MPIAVASCSWKPDRPGPIMTAPVATCPARQPNCRTWHSPTTESELIRRRALLPLPAAANPCTQSRICPRCRTAFSQNQFEEALSRYRRLAQLRLDAEDWHHLGMCENNCGHPEAAIRALETASRIDPAELEYYEALALIHQARHDRDATRRLQDT